MPIRVEQSLGGIGGLAAYAAGRGRAQERTRKYALDLYQEQQRLQAQRENLIWGAQQAWGRQLQYQQFRGDLAEKQMEAGRIERLGIEERGAWGERVTKLPPIPPETSPEERKRLEGIRSALQAGIYGRTADLQDPKHREKLDALIVEYEKGITAIPKADPSKDINKNAMIWDPTEGLRSWRAGDPKPQYMVDPKTRQLVPWPVSAEDEAALTAKTKAEAETKERAKAEATRIETFRKEWKADWNKLQEERRAAERADEPTTSIDAAEQRLLQQQVTRLMNQPASVEWVKQKIRERTGKEPTPAEITQWMRSYVDMTYGGNPAPAPKPTAAPTPTPAPKAAPTQQTQVQPAASPGGPAAASTTPKKRYRFNQKTQQLEEIR